MLNISQNLLEIPHDSYFMTYEIFRHYMSVVLYSHSILHGCIDRNLQNIPFHGFHSHLVPLIPYSAITKTALVRIRIFHIFTLVSHTLKHIFTLVSHTLKQRLKQKRRLSETKYNSFSHSLSYRNIFYLIKIHN